MKVLTRMLANILLCSHIPHSFNRFAYVKLTFSQTVHWLYCVLQNKLKQAVSLTERNNTLSHSRNCCCGRILLWYLASRTSAANSDVIFLLGDPEFLYKGDEISRPSRLVFEIRCGTDRQTTDRRHTLVGLCALVLWVQLVRQRYGKRCTIECSDVTTVRGHDAISMLWGSTVYCVKWKIWRKKHSPHTVSFRFVGRSKTQEHPLNFIIFIIFILLSVICYYFCAVIWRIKLHI